VNISSFKLTNILQLVRGSILAQLVFVIVTPVLTRIYTPEQMGIFGVFFAAVLVLSRIACLRFDLAIPLPRTDAAAFHLLIAAFVSSIFLVLTGICINRFLLSSNFFGQSGHVLQRFDVVLAIGIISFVTFEALTYWNTRHKKFDVVANGKIITSTTLAASQLMGFFFNQKLIILLVAYPISMFIGIVYMLRKFENAKRLAKRLRIEVAKKVIYRHRDFPLVSVWTTSLTELAQSLPLLVITFLFGNTEAGFFFLARRIGLVPTSVVGRAISLVNYSDMADVKKNDTLKEMLVEQIRNLQYLTLIPATLLALLAPSVSSLALGDTWRDVGVFLLLMTPFVYIKLIFSPMNAINYIQGWQKIGISARELLSPTLKQLLFVVPIVALYFIYFK